MRTEASTENPPRAPSRPSRHYHADRASRSGHKRALFAVVLLSFMMPFEAIVILLCTLMRGLGWTDTYAALILPEVAGGLVIFLFRQFFAGIPKEIYEAARPWLWNICTNTMPGMHRLLVRLAVNGGQG